MEESSIKHIVTTCLPCRNCLNKLLVNSFHPTVWYFETSKNSTLIPLAVRISNKDLHTQKWSEVPGFVPWHAKKVGGSYQAEGHVISEFETLAGAKRYVFEFDQMPGMLHIFNDSQIAEFSNEN
jgi:hypothetical protein